jgi:NAD(P)H-flavin reductase
MEITGIMVNSATLIDIIKEAEDTYTYKFNIPSGATWDAGTNAHLVANGIDTDFTPAKEFTRHMSICSLPEEGFLGFTTRVRKGGSTFKRNLKVSKIGDKLQIYGLKNRLPLTRNGKSVILVSMGVGIATMRPMILEYAKCQNDLPKLISINIDKDETFIYKQELDKANIKNFENYYVNSRRTLFQQLFKTLSIEDAEYHVVGSDEFIEGIAHYLLKNDVDAEDIKLDKKPKRAMSILEKLKDEQTKN